MKPFRTTVMKTAERLAPGFARCLFLLSCYTGLAIYPGTAAAFNNIGFMKDAPLTHFSGPDLALFESNTVEALNHTADGDVRRWQNPKTGSSGEIGVVKSLDRDGKRCRQTRVTNRARGYAESTFDLLFCREADGTWKVATPATPAAKPPAGKPATGQ